jgi:hypothetical protein
MSTAAKTERYTAEPAEYGWDIVDSTTGESIGVCPDEHEAVKTVQRTNALHSANVNRIERARIKREIHSAPSMAASREVLAAVLEDNPPALATMRVEALVAACSPPSSPSRAKRRRSRRPRATPRSRAASTRRWTPSLRPSGPSCTSTASCG